MITGTLLVSAVPVLPTLVPNRFPLIPPGECRLAVIGEAPGEDELRGTDSRGNPAPEPFIGVSGRFLRALIGNAGLACDQLFFGNICQHNPPHNEIEKFEWEGPEIQGGLEQLRKDLEVFKPHCVLLLGRTAFRAFRPDLCVVGSKGTRIPLADWRGSLYLGTGVHPYKCIASYHPAYILRQYADIPFLRFDITRAARQGTFPELRVKARTGILRPQPEEILSFLQEVSRSLSPLTLDIEGYADDVGVTMLSLCTSSTHGIVIPFWIDSRNYFSEEDEVLIWQTLSLVLADPRIPKTAHNAFYELFVLAWRHRILINNLHDDTMMKHWEVFPEAGGDADDDDTGDRKRQGLGRDLGTCTSIYTEHPFYKADRLSHDSEVKLQYNLTDSLVTYEINAATETILASRPASYQHYRFNINLIPAYNYIMLRGCKFDVGRAASLAETTAGELAILQRELDGTLVPLAEAAGVLKRKRKSDPYTFNVKSPKQKAWYLYDYLGCKPLVRWGRTTKEVTLFHYLGKTHDPTLRLLIRAVRKRTRISDIHKLLANADGRIRSSFDPVGTNTGRLSSRESTALELIAGEWTNTGTNLQNVTKELRACFIPDSPDFAFWQCDLKGADGWTVAADLAALGYPAMLEDYNAGISPAVVLYYMLQEHAAGRNPGAVNTIPRHELKTLLKTLKRTIDSLDGQVDTQGRPLDWQYLCCKRIQHGSNYGAAPEKISEVIFGDSDGTIDLSKKDATLYQQFYKLRYQTDHRNLWIRKQLTKDGALTAACGIRRQFFNIRNRYDIDDAVVREASAFEPQANTTWATNKALERLWYDPSNRQSTGALYVEPLLQIHDALAGQFRLRDREWATGKLGEWFQNPIRIHGIGITIPAPGNWGESWKDCHNAF